MYDVLDVSRLIIEYSNKRRYGITNLRLQKILYFMQLHFLYVKERPCFEAPIEAWDVGPVVPIAYYELNFPTSK